MAVATHVSRVAKEYAPYGYSIMEDITVYLGAWVAANDGNTTLLHAPDCDVFIESVSYSSTTTVIGGASTFDLIQVAADGAGGASLLAAPVAPVVVPAPVAANVQTPLVITGNQIIPQGGSLALDSVMHGGSSTVNLTLHIRYRRQA